MDFGSLFAAAISGGLVVKAIEIGYAELRKYLDRGATAKALADQHFEPLLTAADELVGKLRSLIEMDFKHIHRANPKFDGAINYEFAGLLYLFGRFWAEVEKIRLSGHSHAISSEGRWKQLVAFLDCMESRRVRIIPRILQRAIGEALSQGGSVQTFVSFCDHYRADRNFQEWVVPVATFLSRTEHTTERQRLLQYGIIIHSMIDTLDPEHVLTRERPSWPNKLSRRSWRDLRYRVFGTYLKDVKRDKYIGPKK